MNASPLIGLAKIDGLAWLRKLFGRALTTPTVRSEVITGLGRPGKAEVSAAIRRRQIMALRRDPTGPLFAVLDVVESRRAQLVMAVRPLFKRLAEGGFHLSPDLVPAILVELGED